MLARDRRHILLAKHRFTPRLNAAHLRVSGILAKKNQKKKKIEETTAKWEMT